MSIYRKSEIPEHLMEHFEPAELGLEPTPEEYVANMVSAFREVWRVLRKDATLWLNLGDSYAGARAGPQGETGQMNDRSVAAQRCRVRNGAVPGSGGQQAGSRNRDGCFLPPGLKPKDLVGIPWRVAFALQDDGWYLRSDIIWAKPNPMPESVTDRPTKSHEYLFLLTKSARYYFDQDAVREASVPSGWDNQRAKGVDTWKYGRAAGNDPNSSNGIGGTLSHGSGRNIRDVWTIATQPFPGAHFAVMPPKLVEPCIKAGTSEKGVCAECGAPWDRVVAMSPDGRTPYATTGAGAHGDGAGRNDGSATRKVHKVLRTDGTGGDLACNNRQTTGWTARCDCNAPPIPATVLDPFAGAGTVGLVADRLRRKFVGVELNPEFARMARNRIVDDCPLFHLG